MSDTVEIEYPGQHSRVTVGTTTYDVSGGAISVPDEDADDVMEQLADVHDVSYTDDGSLTDEDICGTEMEDGEVCKRPAGECPYHDNEED